MQEPTQTAVLLAISSVLLLVSAAFSRVSRIVGVPVVLLFLAVGMLAGSQGVGGIHFEDYALSFRLGMIGLVLILFDGGLNTPLAAIRRVRTPAGVLATFGVLGTAALIGVLVHTLGFSWGESFLLGAIVSSTDAAAVFSVLRAGTLRPRARLAATLEAESGINDPMAVILTIGIAERLVGHTGSPALLAIEVVLQLVIGAAVGAGVGRAGRWMLARIRPAAGGLYPIVTLGLAFFAFGAATLAWGSGFLAVYVAGVVLGNGPMPYRGGVLRVHDAIAWLAQIVMFLALGLLVFPTRLVQVAAPGLAIALGLALVVRPLVVLICLAPFKYSWNEKLFIGWMGLRGAVPIILGIYPVLAGVPRSDAIFNLVFFVVVVSVLVQGGTARWVTRRLGLGVPVAPTPTAILEVTSTRPLTGDVMSFYVGEEAAVFGTRLSEIPFPPGAGAMLVLRGSVLLPPSDSTVLQQGDHVYVFCLPSDRPSIQLLFGRSESN